MGVSLRIWSEFLRPSDLAQAYVTDLLAQFRCGVLVKARAEDLGQELANALQALTDGDVPDVGLWLLLEEGAGYWPSERNVGAVRELANRVIGWQQPVSWLVIDLEPPLEQARALGGLRGVRRLVAQLRQARRNLHRERFEEAAAAYREVLDEAHGAGLRVLCAAHDYLAEDVWLGRPALQDLHEAPVLGLPWDDISVMLYGSLMEVPPEARRRWLYETAVALRPAGVGASIGLTSSGVLGNEPVYAAPGELAADAGALKAAGVQDFAIYSLEGILRSGSPREWLAAVAAAEPRVPAPSRWVRRERLRRRMLALLVDRWRALQA